MLLQKVGFFLLVTVLSFRKIQVHSLNIYGRSSTDEINVENEYVILTQGEIYKFVCESYLPVTWRTTGKLTSFRMENTIEVVDNVYSNTLQVRFTVEGSGYLSCLEEPTVSSNGTVNEIQIYVYIRGERIFAEKGSVIDLNYVNQENMKIIPCRTTLLNIVPQLTFLNRGEIVNGTFDPKRGFTLGTSLKPGSSYTCCVQDVCERYDVIGQSFKAYPDTSSVFPFSNTPIKLECQGDDNLYVRVESQGYDDKLEFEAETITLFPGGPTRRLKTYVMNPKNLYSVNCSDFHSSHTWNIEPSSFPRIMNNHSSIYLSRRSSFMCSNKDKSLQARNLFCENINNCDLKLKCFLDESCPDSIKTGTPCDIEDCMSLRDPFSTGIFECKTTYSSSMIFFFTGLDRQKYERSDRIPTRAIVQIEEFVSPHYHGLDGPLLIVCRHTLFTLARGGFFLVKFHNGTYTTLTSTDLPRTQQEEEILSKKLSRDIDVVSVKFLPTPDMVAIFCIVSTNTKSHVNDTRALHVIASQVPRIGEFDDEKTFFIGDDVPQHLILSVNGQPPPEISWGILDANGTKLPLNKKNVSFNKSVLTIEKIDPKISGVYYCYAENKVGNITKLIHIKIRTESRTSYTPIILTSSVSTFLIVCCASLLFINHRRRKQEIKKFLKLSEKEVTAFFQGNLKLANQSSHGNKITATDVAIYMPYNNLYEIPETAIKYSFSDILGKGQFGVVYKGTLNGNKTIAVKTVQDCSTKSAFTNLLSEIKVMIYLGFHPNVVEFIGAVTDNISQMEAFAIVEFCSNGDLHSMLCSTKNEKDSMYSNETAVNLSRLEAVMLRWCFQICSGMEHLEKRKIVHGDLATRNVLLDSNFVAKVADFGLSNKVVDYSEYTLLPWRWMAIESLKRFNFSFATDVWSVGVTVWEIFSFGETPYAGLSWNYEFIESLEKGNRLLCPTDCPDNVYKILLQTWNTVPLSRLTITQLKDFFYRLLSQDTNMYMTF